ncbi:guanine deaminase [Cedecea sp.]|jgi:guanine deaminase|uniref:guanine deaminase n=1 Tax=Cedecea sp. TaxID=1970739 RepID=UPI0012ADD2E8|nr:guanine deaminase [Enterobacteriaceae bacterium RIT693]
MVSIPSFASIIGYRGEIIHFTGDYLEDKSAYQHYSDGILLVDGGKILKAENYSSFKDIHLLSELVDYRGKILVPGFIDTHVHYTQMEMLASYGNQLLDWLNKDVFPTEMKFSSSTHSQKIASFFLDELVKNGTTTALVFASTYPQSVDAFFMEAQKRNMRMISGKVLMDRNAPAALLDTPESAYRDSEALIKKWHNNRRLQYAVTPRFAPTSSEQELRVAGDLLAKYPDLYLHTHIAENQQETEVVKKLFPYSESYLDVYGKYGLLTPRSVFAHAVYLSNDDFNLLARHHSAVAFCPMSNLFLGSGLFNYGDAVKSKVKIGLGTDMGGGNDLSILRTMSEAYKVTMMRKAGSQTPDNILPVSPLENLYLATLGGAKALDLDNHIGSFLPGREADFIVLDPQSRSILDLRVAESTSLEEKLFAFEMLGDDRTVLHTYIMGKKMK